MGIDIGGIVGFMPLVAAWGLLKKDFFRKRANLLPKEEICEIFK